VEDIVAELVSAGIAVELLVGLDLEQKQRYGVRLRTFGKQLPQNRMIIAAGNTFSEALCEAVEKAEQRRWEHLVWSARPWDVYARTTPGTLYGLDAASGAQSGVSRESGATYGYGR
jgi:hypothetical protein